MSRRVGRVGLHQNPGGSAALPRRGQYDRGLEDIFAVQSEISLAILGAVGVEVREAELARIRRRPTDDLSAYEAYMRGYAAVFGMETLSLRYFNVFGPFQDPNGAYAAVIPAWVARLLHGEKPVVYGDGEHTRYCAHAQASHALERVRHRHVNVNV